uniref:Uncharacterized protein n=1 Tax=Anguilla anguilla TaxID=7936 RepID=A0A0E9UXA0_ANGAN
MLILGQWRVFSSQVSDQIAVLSGAIRRTGKPNQSRVLQSDALCSLNLDP